MLGESKNLKWFGDDGVRFEIPYFQRPYVWDEVDWKNLIDGINDETDSKMPFIGSIILKSTYEGLNRIDYLVIDGQQRLTTLSILIKAFLDSKPRINDQYKSILLSMIYETDDQHDEPIHTCRIKPSNSDSKEFKLVMSDVVDEVKLNECKGKIAQAYRYYKDLFDSYSDNDKQIISNKLRSNVKFFIAITVEDNDDEQKIFDSVNSLGKKLTNADIIKNYLYQQLKNKSPQDETSQNNVLEKYKEDWENVFYSENQKEFWNNDTVIGRIETTKMEVFFKDYGILKGIYSPLDKDSFKGIVNAYKKYIDGMTLSEISSLSKDISEYANAYFQMFSSYYDCTNFTLSDRFNTTMLILDKMQTSTFNPYMLKLYKDKPDDIDEQYYALQRFLIKRLVYGMSTKNYNKLCEQLLEEEINPIDKLDNYVDFNDVNFNEYPRGLLNIANSSATLILYLIEMIKRNGSEELIDNEIISIDKLSLEHIMPKKWTSRWLQVPCYKKIDDKGNISYEQVSDSSEMSIHRNTKINSIGNMTLLTNKLNTSISNNSFKVKVNGDGSKKGIKSYVSLIVAKEILEIYDAQEKWDEINIYEREVDLFNTLNSYFNFI